MTYNGRPMKSGRWLRVAFLVSCGVNLVVAGTFVGAVLYDDEQRVGGKQHVPEASLLIGGAVFHELGREERIALRDLAQGDHRDVLERRKVETEALLDLIRAPEVDVEVLRNTIAIQHERLEAIRVTMQDAWIERVISMSLSDRNHLADRVENHLRRPPPPP